MGRFRAFFDMDMENQLIKVVAVGYKEGSRLLIFRGPSVAHDLRVAPASTGRSEH